MLADPLSLKRIFQNLIDNSVKFSDYSTTITISAAISSNGVILKVKDQGIGIPPEHLSTLFDSKEHDKNRSGTEGEVSTGLGLSIVKSAVELNNGHIWVDSQVGKGSSFYFELKTPYYN